MCWVTDRRAPGKCTNTRVSCERQAGPCLRSTASVTGSVKTGDPGEGQLVNGQQSLASDWSMLTPHWPLIGRSWAQRESLLVGMCQAWSQNNHKINDPKCLDGHLLKMGTIIVCEKEPKCFHPDHYIDNFRTQHKMDRIWSLRWMPCSPHWKHINYVREWVETLFLVLRFSFQ